MAKGRPLPGRRSKRIIHRPARRIVSQRLPLMKGVGGVHRAKPPAGGFTPYKTPTSPPSGTYDPALDAQQRAAQRGLGDTTQDVERTGQRSLSDFLLGQGNIVRERTEGLADIARSESQTATRQSEGAAASGVFGGGALIEALQKRRAHFGLQESRLKDASARRLGGLSVDYQRGVQDRTTALSRAQRENTFFGQDIGQQRWYQARSSGATLPTKPANEHTRHGLTFQLSGTGNKRVYTLASGQKLSRAQYLKTVRRRKRG